VPDQPTFVGTVRLLWRMAFLRAQARTKRTRQIFRRRQGAGTDWGILAYPLQILVGIVINAMFAFAVVQVADEAMKADIEAQGKLIVQWRMSEALERVEKDASPANIVKLEQAFDKEAERETRNGGQSAGDRLEELRGQYQRHGVEGFVRDGGPSLAEGLRQYATPLAEWTGLLMIVWWFVMVTFQGEGLDLDVQRRRHPMWEWLFSHPARPGAVFLAEMLAPLAANPNVILAPIFWFGVLAAAGHGVVESILPAILIGLPLAVAAACLNKALEIGAMLRFAPRSRGAILGLMSWLGFASYTSVFLISMLNDRIAPAMRWLEHFTPSWSPPVFGWIIQGGYWFDWPLIAVAWLFSVAVIAVSVVFSARATERGLAGGFGDRPVAHKILSNPSHTKWLGDPLYRKELLWFWRDRSAVVQTILIPVTVAAFQLINFRHVLSAAAGQWHWMCTVAIVFGTYFLFILGPRSLISEGPALWMALTWPRGMESLLRAKARLWSVLANLPVGLAFGLTVFLFPAAWWKVILVAMGWWFFSRSLAQKAVTLVQVPGSSGEPEPMPRGRRMAAWLGTFTFATGVATQQWNLAFVGVVYSWMTSAAMWQHFRERLPYLFDPWSERLPTPPTVMHAMVAIFGVTEIVAILSAIAIGFGGTSYLWMVHALAYAVVGFIAWIVMAQWLARRGVANRQIWRWESAEPVPALWKMLGLGLAAGIVLAYAAKGYLATLPWWWPQAAEAVGKAQQHFTDFPGEFVWLALAAVCVAPPAEEYLFRGLLFRSLDREWGGWRAVLGSAGFFAIYHPPSSWLPVFAVGAFNALLFRHSRSLWPCVLTHAVYNFVVVVL